ncbi:PREDICTED: uncharacterized protein LOC106793719 [Polistes canadensis]|uniref:uncharacterized protein LOC106793719 n=1 Tax=Polistes canadensis TaxID=91411 RepID=UPI000719010F|nr:PREDICTED: uncharacterized protein LOC106793719 [Polistes canadensis]
MKMKCFRTFFKRTWHPQQINNNNSSIFESIKTNVQNTNAMELKEMDVVAPTQSVATLTVVQPGSIPCQNSGCKNWRTHGVPENPWHELKTIFLVSIIVTLIFWIMIYALLAQYQIF